MDAFVNIMRPTKVRISDVKTRVNSSLPRSRRTAEMQLSLYHQLLANMIDGKVDFNMVCSALDLDPDNFFSDGFLVEVGASYSDAGILPFEALLENNTLNVCLHFLPT